MTPIEAAILRTVIYADAFSFPMTIEEIHHFLIHDQPVSHEQVEQAIAASDTLKAKLCHADGYVVCAGREHLIPLRSERERASQHLWPLAVTYGRWLGRLPFVRMVAMTGALAMRNAASMQDDLDYLLVTTARRVWLARAFSIVLVRLGRLGGVNVCPNYVLSENALEQDRRDLFVAHEVTQMVPLYGETIYDTLRAANPWANEFLPNAQAAFYDESQERLGGFWSIVKRALEWTLGGRIGDTLEHWEYKRKLRRFAPELNRPHNAAQLDDQRVKGHFNDHGHPTLEMYYWRVRQEGLEEEAVPMAGD